MNLNVLSPKYAEEVIYVAYNFIDLLLPGEIISSALWTSSIKTGIDSNASLMISGDPDLSLNPIIKQKVINGISGNTYVIKCKITTQSRILVHSEILIII